MSLHRDLGWLTSRPIAHRGLHDEASGVHENSLTAFRAAVEAGFAIECDIHLSADGVPIVFHDETLSRLTGVEGKLAERTADDLAALRLKDSADHIPTLRELLDLVAGRVPLVVEMKGADALRDDGFAEALRPLFEAYEGPLVLMSFDDWLVDQALALGVVPVGLTAEGIRPDSLSRHQAVFERGCAFVSYNVHHLPNPFVEWVREEKRSPIIAWTVRTPTEAEHSARYADQITFEGFTPKS